MRDRLLELGGVSAKAPPKEGGDDDADGVELEQHAVVFESQELMSEVFQQVQAIQKEACLLRLEVKRLGKQNTRLLTSVRRFSSIKRDSSSIARSIRTKAEHLHARIQKLQRHCRELEEQHGAQSALVRMARCQLISTTSAFHQLMDEYQQAESTQRDNCTSRIQRQAEIMGRELSGDQIQEMMEGGGWSQFSEELLAEGRAGRHALGEIQSRHKELLELEGRVRDVHQLFFQLALLVEEQGSMVENIQAHVCATQDYVGKAGEQIKKAVKYKKKNPCRQIFCCCFPCCNK